MALTGRLEADFTSFQAAVQQAEVTLKGFEQGAGKVESSLTRMSNSLSGTSIIQQATIAAEAVERIGGVSKLTEAELRRVSAIAAEATQKLTALGQEVPAGIANIAAQAKVTTSEFGTMRGMLTSLAGAFGLTFSIGTVVQFGRAVIAAGDAIQKMADQTGLTVGQVQAFQYIAGQSGTSIDALVGAVQNLQQRLGDDSSGAAGAFKKLNINVDAFSRLGAYEQMITLAEAIRAIKDPTEQASIAAAVFGKSWKEILPAIKSGMEELGAAAPKMSAETVTALDQMGDAFTGLLQKATAAMGGLIAKLWEAGFNFETVESISDGLTDALGKIPPRLSAASTQLSSMGRTAAQLRDIEQELTDKVKESIAAHEKEAEATKKAADAYAAEQAKIDAAIEAHKKIVADIGAELFGGKAIEEAANYAESIETVAKATNLAAVNAEGAKKAADALWKGEQALIANAVALGIANDPLVETFEKLRIALTATGRDAEATAIKVSEAAKQAVADVAMLDALQAAALAGAPTSSAGLRFNQNQFSIGGINAPGRAFGGAVSAGRPYMVGEQGPELFIPSSSGSIAPGGSTVIVNMSGMLVSSNPSAREELRRFVSDIVAEGMKRSRKVSAA